MRLDLPAPFGPMTAVKLSKGPIVTWPAYDLKLLTWSLSMRPMVLCLVERGCVLSQAVEKASDVGVAQRAKQRK